MNYFYYLILIYQIQPEEGIVNHQDSFKNIKMKKNLSLLFVFCSGISLFGQSVSEKNADLLFEKKSFVKAAEMYEKIKENQNVLEHLGDCYYYNSEMKEAAAVYEKLFSAYKGNLNKETYFKYAQSLYGIGDYVQADLILSEYDGSRIKSPEFIAKTNANLYYKYDLQPMDATTSNGDFGVSFYGKQLVFASSRNLNAPKFNWNEKPFLDLYVADVTEKGFMYNVKSFSKDINTDTHESSATFSSDRKIMYFNRTNTKKVEVGNESIASIKIYKAEFVDGKWTNVSVLPFCSDTYSTEHPFLSSDGRKLYFASDMPGSIGSLDLYEVDIHADSTFGTPQNLGNTINTIHREQFPSLSNSDSILYFSSDGHQGIGGLDIFSSQLVGGVFEKPLNLGESINSNLDDFGFVIEDNKNVGYLSSNRKNGDQLYHFTRTAIQKNYSIEGIVRDKKTKELLTGSLVSLYDSGDLLIAQMEVDADAYYVFNTAPFSRYRIEATKDFYIPHSEIFTTNEEGKLRYNIELFMDHYDDVEEMISKGQDGKIQIVLENIYFDLDKWTIKADAARILNGLYDLLLKYSKMEIELGAHTDSRASTSYNLGLSNKRAAATMNYLIKKGINKKRLRSKGYGESEPLISCGGIKKCSEAEHSMNRRCEFVILK